MLQILALATIPGILNQPLAVFLQATGLDRIVAIIMTVNVVIALVLIGVLSGLFGAVGAAVAALVTQGFVATALIVIAARHKPRFQR
ncbi:polysaccharide biosynthesis C-terminal domain-containing protein [Leifsonia sp. L25]|uniref:polysaccharide biosynthesis C-terminal domain-containing protein n=1 Tax=Leifsonia sp. L25 TaxID=3423957 RepID=UPI003D68D470